MFTARPILFFLLNAITCFLLGCDGSKRARSAVPATPPAGHVSDGLADLTNSSEKDGRALRTLPTVSLAEALTLAQRYIAENRIETKETFLESARYLEKGSSSFSTQSTTRSLSGPCWQITYGPTNKLTIGGGFFDIYVYMDRRVGHAMGL